MTELENTFKTLGVCDALCEACEILNWKEPTKVQKEVIPLALEGKDIIGLAETGSGKTGAFAIPIIQALMKDPQRYFALVLTPTRELALQVQEQFQALGKFIGLTSVCLVGGLSASDQAKLLQSKSHHIIIATPGRFVWHVEKTKGFSEFHLKKLKFLVLDEGDRMLGKDFEKALDKVVRCIPRERTTFLFSATMTNKMGKLQRAALREPVKINVNQKYQTTSKLNQFMIVVPEMHKEAYLALLLKDELVEEGDKDEVSAKKRRRGKKSIIIFSRTRHDCQRLSLVLRELDIAAVPLSGDMPQSLRIGALGKFKAGKCPVLVATDVASRGLDIPEVDLVVNYDLTDEPKTYLHRVGRTARAGLKGRAISFVTQYTLEQFKDIEEKLGSPETPYVMPELWPEDAHKKRQKGRMLEMKTQVSEAVGRANMALHDITGNKSDSKKQSRKRQFSAINDFTTLGSKKRKSFR